MRSWLRRLWARLMHCTNDEEAAWTLRVEQPAYHSAKATLTNKQTGQTYVATGATQAMAIENIRTWYGIDPDARLSRVTVRRSP